MTSTINTTGSAKGILRLPHRWQRVVHNAGDYIEGQQNFETCIYFASVVNKYLPLLKLQPSYIYIYLYLFIYLFIHGTYIVIMYVHSVAVINTLNTLHSRIIHQYMIFDVWLETTL